MKKFRNFVVFSAAAFMLGIGSSVSAYEPQLCWQCAKIFRACVATTGDFEQCYYEFETCTIRNGCPGA